MPILRISKPSMIDPVHSLAFSIQANRGVYAVLVGSGVSWAAKIPTGREITLDLILKLANIKGIIYSTSQILNRVYDNLCAY